MQDKKIKILRIIARLNIGGPATHAALLTSELNNDEFESRLISGRISKDEGNMEYVASRYHIKPVYIPALKREISLFSDFLAFLRIYAEIRKYRPDIVHTHTAKAGALGRLAAVLAGTRVRVHTFHGNIFQGYFDDKSTKFFLSVEKFLARFTDAIITVSSLQKEDIAGKYKVTGPAKCHVIMLGFDLDRFLDSERKREIFRRKYNFTEKDIAVGIVGRFAPIKNHKMFINTVQYIARYADNPLRDRIKFVVVGDGEEKSEILAYSGFKEVRDRILFTGWIREIDGLYAGLDMLVSTSINEGTPVSLIEAMASSKPVIATDVGGVRDAVGDIGILVPSNDHVSMANEILRLASSKEKREELGKRGREFVKNTYSKERLVAELSELYRELIISKTGLR